MKTNIAFIVLGITLLVATSTSAQEEIAINVKDSIVNLETLIEKHKDSLQMLIISSARAMTLSPEVKTAKETKVVKEEELKKLEKKLKRKKISQSDFDKEKGEIEKVLVKCDSIEQYFMAMHRNSHNLVRTKIDSLEQRKAYFKSLNK
ncbi:hypothetical protein [Aquimarina brevivitae]|uniref:DUF4142 domain-containing protein n=1 Tax=Aquimarina brevivitae TaxID=323412 RepID=A0A4Q7P2C9_9FLAO|nr:hypothetical protein [Aquimarina brevivitae]RZS93747.1 hypothetical protein EV197_2327 [Aquimarina brevivitae]